VVPIGRTLDGDVIGERDLHVEFIVFIEILGEEIPKSLNLRRLVEYVIVVDVGFSDLLSHDL
jgi:hypothetical protein